MANEITKVTDKNNVDHPLRDAAAQTALTGILNGQSIDSFGDVENALEDKVDWESNTLTGVHNLINITEITANYIHTVNNGEEGINSSGTLQTGGGDTFQIFQQGKFMLPIGRYKISLEGNCTKPLRLASVPSSGSWVTKANVNAGDDIEFEINQSDTSNTLCLFFYDLSNGDVINWTYFPMIRLATDTDSTYAPYAKTNRELTDDSFFKNGILPANTDLNNIKDAGIYHCAGVYTHTPFSDGNVWGTLEVIKGTDVSYAYIVQTITVNNSGIKVFKRLYGSSAWTNWFKFEGTEIIPS